MVISCRQDEGEEWWALIWNGRKISYDVRGNQKRTMMHVWSLVSSEKCISKGKWRFLPRIWRSRSSKDGCLMILSHCRWTAMAVMNIALRWQWTLMVVMILYKRTSKLQRWWTTLAVMNSIDEPTSFNGGELIRQLWTCLFQWEFALRHKTPKKWLAMSVKNSPPKKCPKRLSMLVMKSSFQECQKEFLRGWWSLCFFSLKSLWNYSCYSIPGVVCMLPQQKDSSSGDFPKNDLTNAWQFKKVTGN